MTRFNRFAPWLAGAALLLPAPARAAPGDTDADLDKAPIVVTGQRVTYGAGTTDSATRTPTPLVDLPQSVSVVTRQQIDDQGIRSIAEALRQVPGAVAAQGEGHRDQIVLRGQSATADFFVDNLRDDVQYYRPLYNLERLEVLRGPNALTFGRGGGGGVINRVTKAPRFSDFAGATASADSFGAWYVDGDANLRLSSGVAARVVAVHEQVANHRQVYGGEVNAVNPTLALRLSPRTDLTLGYEFNDDRRVVDRGVPSFAGRPISGYRDTFFGNPLDNRSRFTANVARATLTHRFSEHFRVTSRLLFGDYDKLYQNLYPNAAATGTGPGASVALAAYRDATQRENLFSQNDFVWEGRTGAVEHTLLAGFEIGRQWTGSQRANGSFGGAATVTVPLAPVIAAPRATFVPGARNARTYAAIHAGYLQDQLKWGRVELLIGLRFDSFALAAVNRLNGQALSRTDALWSPRAGLVFHPTAKVSTYFSYARSYLPQSGDQFTSLDLTSAALKPERFDSYELGAKWEPRAGLLVAAALYQLDRSNTRAAGPNPGEVVLTGAQRSRGLELEARGAITNRWNVSFAYALTEAVITQTTSAAPAGSHVPLVPRHTLGLFTRYEVTPRFGVGGGVSYFSERFTSISNAVTLPGYARVDAALFYRLTKTIEAQVNVENLFDAGYFPTAHTDNNISTGAPINARATLRVRF